jgi:hypothetical protein
MGSSTTFAAGYFLVSVLLFYTAFAAFYVPYFSLVILS